MNGIIREDPEDSGMLNPILDLPTWKYSNTQLPPVQTTAQATISLFSFLPSHSSGSPEVKVEKKM